MSVKEKLQGVRDLVNAVETDLYGRSRGDRNDDSIAPVAPEDITDPPYLWVGRATAKPGRIVRVDILGHTIPPVNGFGLAIGTHAHVSLVGHDVSDLAQLIGVGPNILSVATEKSDGGPGYSPGRFIHAYAAFMPTILDSASREIAKKLDELDARHDAGQITHDEFAAMEKEIKAQLAAVHGGGPADIAIPPQFRLMTLRLKVSPAAAPGSRLELVNKTKFFGAMKMSHGNRRTNIRVHNIYTTNPDVSRDGLYPNLVSGYIEVV